MSPQSGFPLGHALLGFLMRGPVHGYALHDLAETELGRIWHMGMSNVYATLKDLENSGCVRARLDDETYPPRKVYAVTDAGRDDFMKWVRQPVMAMRDMRVEFLAKLYFFHTLKLKGIASLLGSQAEVCKARLQEMDDATSVGGDEFDSVVTDFRRRRIEACLEWLASLEGE